jgi:hypothetical protein|tara:strand:- start:45 stop:287 length:243 start_codon:yes stop_codon:yes gene_type:complete
MTTLLDKLGQNPQRSLRFFLFGIGLFLLSLLFIGLGYYHHHLWQIPGVILLVIACLITAWGYLGIFANRWLNILSRHKPN